MDIVDKFERKSGSSEYEEWVKWADLQLSNYVLKQQTTTNKDKNTVEIKVSKDEEKNKKIMVTATIHPNNSLSLLPDAEELENGGFKMEVAIIFAKVHGDFIIGQIPNPQKSFENLVRQSKSRLDKQN